MQLENLTKEQFIRDFKDTLHQEQLIKVAKATPTEIFTALAGLIRKYYTNTWIERNQRFQTIKKRLPFTSQLNSFLVVCWKQTSLTLVFLTL